MQFNNATLNISIFLSCEGFYHVVVIAIMTDSFWFAEHGEGLQVLHYEVGQKYEPHFDYFLDEYNTKNGGQRMATLLMYLYVWYSFIMYWLQVLLTGFLINSFTMLSMETDLMLKKGVRLFSLMQM